MAEDPLKVARDALTGAAFCEVALNAMSVALIFEARDRQNLRLNTEAVGHAEAPVPDDAELDALNARLVERVTPLFGLEVADLRRREDNAYVLVFENGDELGLFRSSDDKISDNVVSLYAPDLAVFLDKAYGCSRYPPASVISSRAWPGSGSIFWRRR